MPTLIKSAWTIWTTIFAFTLMCLSGSAFAHISQHSQSTLSTLLKDPKRPADDAIRDPLRLPHKIMAFSGISPGDRVLDLFAGAGWYTELFSRAVGKDGKVYAQNDSVIWRFAEKPLNVRTADNRLANVVRLDRIDIAEINLPDNSLDLVFSALNYHDLFFTEFTRDGKTTRVRDGYVDHKAALAAVKRLLKPDGVFVIVDHAAKPGSGYEAANALHRIDPQIVKTHLSEAGFTLVEEAFYLRNEKDDLSVNVFEPEIRGRTDRFVFKFVPVAK